MTGVQQHNDPANAAPDVNAPTPLPMAYDTAYAGMLTTADRLRRVVSASSYVRNVIEMRETAVMLRITVPDALESDKAYDVAIPILDAARQSSPSPEAAKAALQQTMLLIVQWTRLEHERCLRDMQRYLDAMTSAARAATPT